MEWLKKLFSSQPSTEQLIADAVAAENKRVRIEFEQQAKAEADLKAKVEIERAELEKQALEIDNAKPSANIIFEDRKMIVKSYNVAFVEYLRKTLGDLTVDKTDDEVIKIFVERENEEYEEPRLDVVHSGITEDGRVQMKLDWNRSFIRHLKENGIDAETEEESINRYLSLITKQAAEDSGLLDAMDPFAAQREIDEMLAVELDEAAKQVEQAQRETRKANRKTRKAKLANNSQ
jgi:hypothetical protein